MITPSLSAAAHRCKRGAALAELAMVLPVMPLLLLALFDFSDPTMPGNTGTTLLIAGGRGQRQG